jgi:hypothetical protein
MIRKRMVGVHVLLGDSQISSLPQSFSKQLVVGSIAVVGFEYKYGPVFQERNTLHVVPLHGVAINLVHQLLRGGSH